MNTLNLTELSTVAGGEDFLMSSQSPYSPPITQLPKSSPANVYAAPGINPANGIELAR